MFRLLAAAFLVFGLVLPARAQKPLVVGMELSYPPFEMTDEKGKPAGIGVELAEALAAKLGRKLEIQNYAFDGLIPALRTGRIDLIISSMTANEERAKVIDFSVPYMTTGLAILVGGKSDIQGIADLDKPGRRIVVKKGTTGADYAREKLKGATTLILEAEAACALEVIQGKADAFIYDQMSIFQFAKKNPGTTRGLLKPFQGESWAIGIKKGNAELKKQVDAFVTEFKASKGLEKLGEKYIQADREVFKEMGYPFQ
ncbi:MAG: transporter substrate-binding domain-containing protein [Verrucomicrobia bacterium]|nr:transporter substrate-binding domain-containing protein [Verrucomicrobiota bacterium]